jgi:Arc/MetJ-type ribon-helix-helix transcriptional regulator
MIKMATRPKRKGRPPVGRHTMGAPIALRFPEEMLEAIDAISASRMDRPDRSAVIRQLVAEALEARKTRRKA